MGNLTATASGRIASFWSPTKTDIRSCKLYFEAIQGGSGDPSPTNVRNISGRTELTAHIAGKNLIPIRIAQRTVNGVTFTPDYTNGTISATGTNNGSTSTFDYNSGYVNGPNIVVPPGKYLWSVEGLTSYSERYNDALWYDGTSKSRCKKWDGSSNTGSDQYNNAHVFYEVTLVDNHEMSPGVRIFNGATVDNMIFKPMLCLPSETDITFEPYKGIDIPISWQSEAGTLYGGYIDLISGQLVVTMGYIPDLSTYEWGYRDDGNRFKTGIIPNIKTGSTRTIHLVCTTFKPIENGEAFDVNWDDVIYVAANCFYIHAHSCGSSVESLVTLLSGVGVVYELETPITYQLTPQQVTSFIGRNNIWSNSGNAEVEYDLYESADIALTRKKHIYFNDYYMTHVPPMYTECDYLETNGTSACIDTGVPGNDNTLEFELYAEAIDKNDYSTLFGNYRGEYVRCWRMIQGTSSSPSTYLFTTNNRRAGSSYSISVPQNTNIVNHIVRIYIKCGYISCEYNGEQNSRDVPDDTTTDISEDNIAIGNIRPGYGFYDGTRHRIHKFFRIKSQGKLIRDYRPCIRNSDNKPGFYDMVNHTFNPSVGNRDFVAGNIL